MRESDVRRLLQRNPHLSVNGAGENAALEPVLQARPLGKGKAKDRDPRRYFVRIVSIRQRLGDPDSLVPKWHLDAIRYLSILPDDTAELLELSVTQRKCAKGEEEKVEIEVYQLNNTQPEVSENA